MDDSPRGLWCFSSFPARHRVRRRRQNLLSSFLKINIFIKHAPTTDMESKTVGTCRRGLPLAVLFSFPLGFYPVLLLVD